MRELYMWGAAVAVVSLLLCGLTSTAFVEGQGHNNEVTTFDLETSKREEVVSSARGQHSGAEGGQDWSREWWPELCGHQANDWTGAEGRVSASLVLEKVHILVVAPPPSTHHPPLPNLPHHHPQPPPCPSFLHMAAQSGATAKVRSYPEIASDYRRVHGKSGLGVFGVIPEGCGGPEDAPAWALPGMIHLGQHLATRYPQLMGQGVRGRSVGEGPAFQSTCAVLHGMLGEKQFLSTHVTKLAGGEVRGLASPHKPCAALTDIETFVEKAFVRETELFRDHAKVSGAERVERTLASLGVERRSATRDARHRLQQTLCGGSVMSKECSGTSGCLNVTQRQVEELGSAMGQHNAHLTSSPVFRAFSTLDTAPYLARLMAWFSSPLPLHQDHHHNHHYTPTPALTVDVAHDFFVLKLLSALGHTLTRPLVPGSRLVIEQLKKSKPGAGVNSPRLWRVLVEGEVVTESLGGCGEEGGTAMGVCGVDSVKAHLKHWQETNMFGACGGGRDEL